MVSRFVYKNLTRYLFKKFKHTQNINHKTRINALNYSTKNGIVLHECSKQVGHFGTLNIQSNCDVSIKSLDPTIHPSYDVAIVKLCAQQKPKNLNNIMRNFVLEAQMGQVDLRVANTEDESSTKCCLSIELPVHFNVNAELSKNACLYLLSMDCDVMNLKLINGSFLGSRLKSRRLVIESFDGNLLSKEFMQGNIQMKTFSGNIMTERIQGPEVTLITSEGNIELKSLYADSSNVKSESGHISLSNLHGSCIAVTKSGTFTANGVDGSLSVETDSGNISVQSSRPNVISLKSCSGNISINVPENIKPYLDLKGTKVNVSPKLKNVCSVEEILVPKILANSAQGNITVGIQDWFSSLNLGFGEKTSIT